MTFKQKIQEADDTIKKGYLDLVVESYAPLFERVKTKATEHMKSEDIPEIDLGIHSGLVFKNNGQFYNKENNLVRLKDLPKIYQDQDSYIAGCADSRANIIPSIHQAMTSALSDFRSKVKKSLTDVL